MCCHFRIWFVSSIQLYHYFTNQRDSQLPKLAAFFHRLGAKLNRKLLGEDCNSAKSSRSSMTTFLSSYIFQISYLFPSYFGPYTHKLTRYLPKSIFLDLIAFCTNKKIKSKKQRKKMEHFSTYLDWFLVSQRPWSVPGDGWYQWRKGSPLRGIKFRWVWLTSPSFWSIQPPSMEWYFSRQLGDYYISPTVPPIFWEAETSRYWHLGWLSWKENIWWCVNGWNLWSFVDTWQKLLPHIQDWLPPVGDWLAQNVGLAELEFLSWNEDMTNDFSMSRLELHFWNFQRPWYLWRQALQQRVTPNGLEFSETFPKKWRNLEVGVGSFRWRNQKRKEKGLQENPYLYLLRGETLGMCWVSTPPSGDQSLAEMSAARVPWVITVTSIVSA